MSQQPQELWRKQKDGSEFAYWSVFKQQGDVGLVTKFKGKGDGYNPESAGPFVQDGWVYVAVQKTGFKTGKQYWDIERRKTAATATTPPDRSEEIRKAHLENLEQDKARTVALENLNQTFIEILAEFRRTNEFLETIAKTLPLQHFKTAKEV